MMWGDRVSSGVLVLVFGVAAIGWTTPWAAPPPVMGAAAAVTPQGIGPYRIGMAEEALLALAGGSFHRVLSEPLVMPSGRTIRHALYRDAAEVEITVQEGRVCAVRTRDPSSRTPEGLGVGSRFGELEAAYGEAEVMAADGQLVFPGRAAAYDVEVRPMPAVSDQRPPASARVVSIAVDRCEREPE